MKEMCSPSVCKMSFFSLVFVSDSESFSCTFIYDHYLDLRRSSLKHSQDCKSLECQPLALEVSVI